MTNKIILFKNFNSELPQLFLDTLLKKYPTSDNDSIDALIYTVRGVNDFNRWQFFYRVDPDVIEIIETLNKEHNNILQEYFTIFSTNCDPFKGIIECDENGKETWKLLNK